MVIVNGCVSLHNRNLEGRWRVSCASSLLASYPDVSLVIQSLQDCRADQLALHSALGGPSSCNGQKDVEGKSRKE